jgi:hypothetical protein
VKEDNWVHRSEGMRCRTCMYYVTKGGDLGRCRRHAPAVSQGWPAVFVSDWCGDHKLDAQRLAPKQEIVEMRCTCISAETRSLTCGVHGIPGMP